MITYRNQELTFFLVDEKGNKVPVCYQGTKPDNFEHATEIVVVGRQNGETFSAEKLLIKCPSKYEKRGL